MMLGASQAERRLLLEGRLAGPMPWVIAIMMFLTALAAAGGLAMGSAASRLGADLGRRVTVEVIVADPAVRERGEGAAHCRADLHFYERQDSARRAVGDRNAGRELGRV